MQKVLSGGFGDVIVDPRLRKIRSTFLNQIDALIDWRPIKTLLNKHYVKGKTLCGNDAYCPLLLFKMSLLQTWYDLSDPAVEDQLNDSISFSRFCQLPMDRCAPDHSTLSRFRKELNDKKIYEKLLKSVNKQLIKHSVIIKKGAALVDATVVDSPLKPRKKATYTIAVDRNEDNRSAEDISEELHEVSLVAEEQPGADTEAAFLKKSGKTRYGYKNHVLTDPNGMILTLETTAANKHESNHLLSLVKKAELPKGTRIKADKGYASAANCQGLKDLSMRSGIMKKAAKNRPLTEREKQFNKVISKERYKIERTFGSLKRWFGAGRARYKGRLKMESQSFLEAIAHNLYRSPGIIMRQP